MFNQLVESKRKKERSIGSSIFSVIFHTILGALAVYGTLNAKANMEKPKEQKLEFVEVKKEPDPVKPDEPPPEQKVVIAPPPKGFQVLTAPVNIPDVIPDVDLTKKVTDEADFSGKGVAGGVAKGVAGGTPINTDQTYFEFQVEKVVASGSCSRQMKYPEVLQNTRVTGEVLAQFVVDQNGKADMSTFKPLKSDHDLFTQSVRAYVSSCTYLPAEVGGHKVKQLVQQNYKFQPGQ